MLGLRRCPLRKRPHGAGPRLLSVTPAAASPDARSSLPSRRTFTSASAVMESMAELIDHAAAGKRIASQDEQEIGTEPEPRDLQRLVGLDELETGFAAATTVHPMAIVHPEAKLGRRVRVGPYCTVGPGVILEDDVVLQSHVVVDGRTHIGRETVIHPFACIGGPPQDKKHNSELTPHSSIPMGLAQWELVIGRKCVIREHVTIHGCTSYSSHEPTAIGDQCWILCGAHVGHDVQIGDHVVLSNNVCVAGHVRIGNFAIIGGQVGLKQHIHIGSLAMVGGGSAVDGDVLPYGLVSGNRAKLLGLNLVGLRRAKISRHEIKLMLRVTRYLFGSSVTSIAAVCPKTGFAPALDLPYHDSVVLRACEAKRYLADLEVSAASSPLVHELVDFVLHSPDRPKSSMCSAAMH